MLTYETINTMGHLEIQKEGISLSINFENIYIFLISMNYALAF